MSLHASHAGSDMLSRMDVAESADFNPRFPCGKRLHLYVLTGLIRGFQSTLPMREATLELWHLYKAIRHFNPRFPCGKRLSPFSSPILQRNISIHASHAGSDNLFWSVYNLIIRFQSTLPMREATAKEAEFAQEIVFYLYKTIKKHFFYTILS